MLLSCLSTEGCCAGLKRQNVRMFWPSSLYALLKQELAYRVLSTREEGRSMVIFVSDESWWEEERGRNCSWEY